MRILTYIKRSLGKSQLYKKHEHLRIEVFSNSNYPGDKRENLPLVAILELEAVWLLRVRSSVVFHSSVEMSIEQCLILHAR